MDQDGGTTGRKPARSISPETENTAEQPEELAGESLSARIKRVLLGAPRNISDPTIFHKISLIAFLAWVGLGADGLSSSSYGPDESFRALSDPKYGDHTYLAIFLAL